VYRGRPNDSSPRCGQFWTGSGEVYPKKSFSYNLPAWRRIDSDHMNQIYLPSVDNDHVTFQPHPTVCSNLTRSSGRQRSSDLRKRWRWTEERSQFANIGLNSLTARLREVEQIGQNGEMNHSNHMSASGEFRRVLADLRLIGKRILRGLQTCARCL
jgi:hypothetical protein